MVLQSIEAMIIVGEWEKSDELDTLYVRTTRRIIRKVVTRCGCSVQVSLGSSGDREVEMHMCIYIYICTPCLRIMQASPLSTFRLRIWVGHELIVYNESALNRRVDAMRQ